MSNYMPTNTTAEDTSIDTCLGIDETQTPATTKISPYKISSQLASSIMNQMWYWFFPNAIGRIQIWKLH